MLQILPLCKFHYAAGITARPNYKRYEYDVAALDTEQSNIWKRLTIIRTEAWFDTVNEIAREHHVTAKLESRYMKSAIIYGIDGRRIGRIWHLDENMPIFFDIKQWISHFEAANTIDEAIGQIAAMSNRLKQ